MTRHQALALMDWPAMPMIAPELVEFRDKLQDAIDKLSRLRDQEGGCPKCAQTQYLGWERLWLNTLNKALNSHPHLSAVAKQFLATGYEHVAKQQIENRLRIEAEATQSAAHA